MGLEPAAIFASNGNGSFLGMPVHDVRDHDRVPHDLMIVASLEQPKALVAQFVGLGVRDEHLIILRPSAPRGPIPADETRGGRCQPVGRGAAPSSG